MNHDYAHCLDYTKDCPRECFRAQLQKDIEERRSEFVGNPLTYAHLGGTDECKLAKDKNVTNKMKWIPVTERLPEIVFFRIFIPVIIIVPVIIRHCHCLSFLRLHRNPFREHP